MDIPPKSFFDPHMLGKRAQRIRVEKKLSIEALAHNADVNKNTVVRFEKGIPTRMETVYKICAVLGVSPLQLIEGKLIQGRDYDIKKHESAGSKELHTKHVPRKDRVHTETYHGMTVGDLNYRLPGGRLSARVLEIRDKGEVHTHPGEELLFCLTGTVGIEVSHVSAVLKKGDAIFFWGAEPHAYSNADEKKDASVALSVVVGSEES
jgi:transcriptional regulator with XRE-family HTH domain